MSWIALALPSYYLSRLCPAPPPLAILGFLSLGVAALAPSNNSSPRRFETTSSIIASSYPTSEHRPSAKPASRPSFTVVQFISFSILLAVVAVQFIFLPSQNRLSAPSYQFSTESKSPASIVLDNLTCKKPLPFSDQSAPSTLHKMSLAEAAKRVAAEFEYGPEALNKGVKEFIREMG